MRPSHQHTVTHNAPPNILFFAGTDPSGGAGAAADISTAVLLGCHPCVIVTAITAQNTQRCTEVHPVPHQLVYAQVREVIGEFPPQALKLSFLGDHTNADLFAQFSVQCPETPIICDPILSTTTGKIISEADQQSLFLEEIFPFCTLITPNIQEAHILARTDSTEKAAHTLLDTGAQAVLMTGDRDGRDFLCHHLYIRDKESARYRYIRLRCPRLPYEYHGAGCTLSAAITAYLAHGLTLIEAISQGQDFCFQALSYAYHQEYTQAIPFRLQRFYDH